MKSLLVLAATLAIGATAITTDAASYLDGWIASRPESAGSTKFVKMDNEENLVAQCGMQMYGACAPQAYGMYYGSCAASTYGACAPTYSYPTGYSVPIPRAYSYAPPRAYSYYQPRAYSYAPQSYGGYYGAAPAYGGGYQRGYGVNIGGATFGAYSYGGYNQNCPGGVCP